LTGPPTDKGVQASRTRTRTQKRQSGYMPSEKSILFRVVWRKMGHFIRSIDKCSLKLADS